MYGIDHSHRSALEFITCVQFLYYIPNYVEVLVLDAFGKLSTSQGDIKKIHVYGDSKTWLPMAINWGHLSQCWKRPINNANVDL